MSLGRHQTVFRCARGFSSLLSAASAVIENTSHDDSNTKDSGASSNDSGCDG